MLGVMLAYFMIQLVLWDGIRKEEQEGTHTRVVTTAEYMRNKEAQIDE